MANAQSGGGSAPLKPSLTLTNTHTQESVNLWMNRHSVHITITPLTIAGHGPTGKLEVALVSASGARLWYDTYTHPLIGLAALYEWLSSEYIPAFADSPF